jgi:predicted nucleic-acid-binding protein
MINNKEMLKQVIHFNKTTFFDNAFKGMKLAQEQGEKMINTMLDQATWLPAEGKKTITDWVKAYNKGVDDFKDAVDEQYRKVEDFLSK